MRKIVLTTNLRVEIENEMRVFLESLDFEIEMRVSQKSATYPFHILTQTRKKLLNFGIDHCDNSEFIYH